ncbi:hypothetical protein SANA_01970 [Gottschalkiaceae bacterium SANA]|nr:hypothetical protein SANA_01970 [Gottschalkiaceae bacterium SANA]
MNILQLAMAVFIFLELMNITMLYFKPGSKIGNGIGVFNAYEKSKNDEEVHNLIKYLVYWVAGTKLIFIALLLVIIFTTTYTTQLFAVAVLIASILSFYWRLYPIMKSMDAKNQITPKGYSKTLNAMIAFFIGGFTLALIVAWI